MVYIPIDFKWIKVEPLFEKQGERPQFVGFRLYIDLSCPFSPTKTGIYRLRIKKIKQRGNVVFHYLVLNEGVEELERRLDNPLEEMVKGLSSIHRDKTISFNEVKSLNSKRDDGGEKRKPFSVLSINFQIPRRQEETQQQSIFSAIINPDEELLTHLSDFSEMAGPIMSTKTKLRGNDAKNKVEEIFNRYGIDKKMQKEFIAAFKIYDFIDGKVDKLLIGSGGVLCGPFGTGKTFIIQNSVKKIFREVLGFGYEEVNLVEVTGGEDSQFWGASMRVINRVFMPVFKKIQSEMKPYFLFIDEGDKFAQEPTHADMEEGISGMKNLLNPKTYPGLIVCLNTNLEQGDLYSGILGRRLKPVEVGYPDERMSFDMWKLYSKKFVFEGAQGNLNDDEYRELARVVAGKIGIDAIETFCRDYRTLLGISSDDDVDFTVFKQEFFKYVLGRISQLNENQIRKLNSSPMAQMMGEQIEILRRKAEEQKRELIEAFSGEGENGIDGDKISGLSAEGKESSYYKAYEAFYDVFENIFIPFAVKFSKHGELVAVSDYDFIKDFYTNLGFLVTHFESTQKEIKNSLSVYIDKLNLLYIYCKNIIIKLVRHGDRDLSKRFPELIGESIQEFSQSDIINVLAILRRDLPKRDELFNIGSLSGSSEGSIIQRPSDAQVRDYGS